MKGHLFPHVTDRKKPPADGILHKTPEFCRRARREVCATYYEDIEKNPGIHTCPCGYSSYVADVGGNRVIYTGLAISGHCDRKKLKARRHDGYLPKIPPEVVRRGVEDSEPLILAGVENLETREFINTTIHEIRKLNTQVKRQCEEASRALKKEESSDFIQYRVENSLATSTLISTRLDFYDIHANPDLIYTQGKYRVGVYKKFEKARHCVNVLAQEKRIRIAFQGECHVGFEAHNIFDLLPFLLLENAIKFSPREDNIEVGFAEDYDGLIVTVNSMGPQLLPEEVNRVLRKGYRGRHAQKVATGTGVGLYFAKMVCDLHDIQLEINSDQNNTVELNGVPYSLFQVILQFKTKD